MTVKKEGMLANTPISPVMDDAAKGVFYRCFGQYFEQNADIHDKNKVRHICPMVDIAMISSICCILD
jgi:dynein heavy chain